MWGNAKHGHAVVGARRGFVEDREFLAENEHRNICGELNSLWRCSWALKRSHSTRLADSQSSATSMYPIGKADVNRISESIIGRQTKQQSLLSESSFHPAVLFGLRRNLEGKF